LARLEGRLAVEAILDRFDGLALAPGFAWRRVRYYTFRGPESLKVSLQPTTQRPPLGAPSPMEARAAG
jgi:hypothetical protein